MSDKTGKKPSAAQPNKQGSYKRDANVDSIAMLGGANGLAGFSMSSSHIPGALSGSASSTAEGWKLTFVDLLALLLVFFVMIYMLIHLGKRPWEDVYTSLEGRFSPYPLAIVASYEPKQEIRTAKDIPSDMVTYWYNYLRFYTKQQQLHDVEVLLFRNHAQMHIELSRLLNEAKLAPGSLPILDSVRDLLTKLTARVEIVSYIGNSSPNLASSMEQRLTQQLNLLSVIDPAGSAGKRITNTVCYSSDPELLKRIEFNFYAN